MKSYISYFNTDFNNMHSLFSVVHLRILTPLHMHAYFVTSYSEVEWVRR